MTYPIRSKVILQNLINCSHYNGMKGTVESALDPTSMRQTVLLVESNKSIAVKPVNMRLEKEEDEFMSAENGGKYRVPTECAKCGSTENLKNCKVRRTTVCFFLQRGM